jgi:hypothetical protein
MSLADHIPTQAEIAARRARMGLAPASSSPVVIPLEPAIKPAKLPSKTKTPAPAVDTIANLVAKYLYVYTPQGPIGMAETKQLVAAIANRHGVTFADIMGPCRRAKIVAARFEAIVAVAQVRYMWSLPQIGRFFGDRDHTTILHAIRTQAVKTGETIRGYTPEEAAYLLDRQRDKNRSAIRTYRSKREAVAT